MQVITYQAPNGEQVDVCRRCERILDDAGRWLRASDGQEYCTVSHGLHRGTCGVCGAVASRVDVRECAALA